MAGAASNSGIVIDEHSGERHIPESVRADGSTRKAIKIRPGYRPPEDVEVYKNRTAETFRKRAKGPIPGAAGLGADATAQNASAASNKNAKRREARKKAKAAAGEAGDGAHGASAVPAPGNRNGDKQAEAPQHEVDPDVEREKKARNLKKKLKQAKELKNKKDEGESLLPEQISKVIKVNELVRELEALGFDAEGRPKDATESKAPKEGTTT